MRAGVALFVRKYRGRAIVHGSQRPWLRHPRALMQPLGFGLIVLKVGEVTAMTMTLLVAFVKDRLPHAGTRSDGRRRSEEAL